MGISARTPWFRPSADQPCSCHNRMVLSRISAPRSGGRFACRELATPDLNLIKQAKQAVWLGDLLDPGGTLLTLGTRAPPRHARESGHPGGPIPCLEPPVQARGRFWTPAFAGVTEDGVTEVTCMVHATRGCPRYRGDGNRLVVFSLQKQEVSRVRRGRRWQRGRLPSYPPLV